MIEAGAAALVFALGAVIGSFLNVCIHRMPKGESVVSPGSHCPHCGKAVRPADNVPLLSYLLLRGKCRDCGAGITPRYFFVELANAVIWLALWFFYGKTPFFYAGAALFSILLAATMTDLETGLIPDKLTFPGMVFGLAASLIWPVLQGETVWYWGLAKSFLGLLAGGGILLATGLLGNAIFKKDSMGGGDIKFLAMMGSFMGPQRAILIFFLAPFAAIVPALVSKWIKKEETIPFGPFLAAAGVCAYLWGDKITVFILKTYGVTNA